MIIIIIIIAMLHSMNYEAASSPVRQESATRRRALLPASVSPNKC